MSAHLFYQKEGAGSAPSFGNAGLPENGPGSAPFSGDTVIFWGGQAAGKRGLENPVNGGVLEQTQLRVSGNIPIARVNIPDKRVGQGADPYTPL